MRTVLLIAFLALLGSTVRAADGGCCAGGSDSTEARVVNASLVYFTTAPGNHGAFLQWRVSGAENLQYFVVERALDKKNFKPLAIVNARAEQPVYVYKDEQVLGLKRSVAYRVRLVAPSGQLASTVKQLRPLE